MPKVSTRREVKSAKHRLQRAIARAQRTAQRCAAQVADGDLRRVDRETAEHRSWLAIKTASELEDSLERVEEALS